MKPTDVEITYFTDQAWLQELWVPKEGDWICTEDSELMGYGARTTPFMACLKEGGEGDFVTFLTTSYGRSTDYVDEIITYGTVPDEIKKRCIWLPTLSNLLGMIESVLDSSQREGLGLSDTWQMTRDRMRGPYCAALLYDDEVYGLGETPVIAAAELLKKVRDD